MTRRLIAAIGCVLLVGLPVRANAAALPAPVLVVSTAGSAYAPYIVVVPTGTKLRLIQLDPSVRHDLVSRFVRKGRPLFATLGTLGFGESAVVMGVEKLRPAFYPFTCSIHSGMIGQLIVRG